MTDSNQYPDIELDSTCFSSESNDNIIGLSKIMYAELEKLIEKSGKDPFLQLVKIVENTFESLFEAHKHKSEVLCQLEELKHDLAMLESKYQREKNEMKTFKERAFELDDALQEKIKEIESLKSKLSSTEKIHEMKMKNLRDHTTRLEDLEKIHQANHTSLRSRYERLLAAHMELSERLRISNNEDEEGNNIPTTSTRSKFITLSADLEPTSSTSFVTNPLLLVSHKGDSPYDWGVHDRLHDDSFGEIPLDADGSPFLKLSVDENCDEVSISEDKSESGDLGGYPSPFTSMQTEGNNNHFDAIKEINKLVNDINEKESRINALNFVIGDLASRLEESDIEKEQLKETLSQMQICRSSMQLHIKQLEEENVRLKADLTELKKMQEQMTSNETPFSRRRNFTREEMAKVLMDRIQLQEDYDDLREKYSTEVNSERHRLSAHDKSQSENSPFLLFFSRLLKRQPPTPPPRVSYDTTTSGISMDFSGTRLFDADTSSPARDRRISNVDSVNVSSCSRGWWIPVPIVGKSCPPEPVVMQNPAVLRKRNSSSLQWSSRGNLSPPLPQHLYLRPISEALSLQMQLVCSTCLYFDVGGLLPSGELMAGRSTFFDPSAAGRNSSSYSNWVCESLSSQLWMCLVGVVDTPVVTAVNVSPDSIPNSRGKLVSSASTSSSPSGVKIESRLSVRSQVVVVDMNKPSRYVDSFCLQRAIVTCMVAVPGAKGRDYEVLRLSNTAWESIPFATPSEDAGNEQLNGSTDPDNNLNTSQPPPSTSQPEEYDEDEDGPASIQTNNTLSSLRHFVETAGRDLEPIFKSLQIQQNGQQSLDSSSTTTAAPSQRSSAFDPDLSLQMEGKTGDFYRVERQKFKKLSNSSSQSSAFGDDFNMISSASAQQTVWIGCQNGDVFIHSCDSSHRRPLQSTRLPAGITAIRHFSGRVFVSLADGHIVVFRRQVRRPADQSAKRADGSLPQPRTSSPIPHASSSTSGNHQLSICEELAEAVASAGAWDLSEAVVIRCAPTAQSPVKSMVIVPTALTLWVGNRNRVLVIDTTTFQRLYAFEVVSKSSHTVRQLCWCRDGVWISLRDDHTLRLFNAFTYELMQTVDMAYIINETVGSPESHLLTVSASVTVLEASADHLWIGTKGGHIACIPFKQNIPSKQSPNRTNDEPSAENGKFEYITPLSSQIDLSGASVSGYGHTESVNFFNLVGGNSSLYINSTAPHSTQQSPSNDGVLMISGGVGRMEHHQKSTLSISHTDGSEKQLSKSQNHLLVWSLPSEESKAT